MLDWLILVLAVAIALTLGVERLMARLGITRVDADSAPRGFQDVLDRLRERRGR